MSLSIRENILQNIKTTLEGITTVNGYDYTIASVQRWNQKGNISKSVPFIIIHSGPEDKTPQPNPQATCKFSISLAVWTRQDDDATTASDETLSSLLAGVEKVLMVDPTRGGHAEDTNILSNIPFETVEGQPSFGIIVEIEIIYKHLLTDPKTYV
jgi:hypothetical protein